MPGRPTCATRSPRAPSRRWPSWSDALDLRPGMRVLDVGCGPGRHCPRPGPVGGRRRRPGHLARLPALAAGRGPWVRADARRLPFAAGSFDAAISLCQGGFGLLGGDDDGLVLGRDGAGRSERAAGWLSPAFSAYFAVRFLEEGDTFDAATGVNHERAEVRDPERPVDTFDLWTTCFTPRELRLMAAAAGLRVHRALGGRARGLTPHAHRTSTTRSSCCTGRGVDLHGARRTVRCALPPRPLPGGALSGKKATTPCPTRRPTTTASRPPRSPASEMGTFDEAGRVHAPPGGGRRPRRHLTRGRHRRHHRRVRGRRHRRRAPSSRSTRTRSCSTSASSPRA